ncbi:MAG: sigma-70 family RNA polymerase sigma factor [Thermomicrobiales bacterium]
MTLAAVESPDDATIIAQMAQRDPQSVSLLYDRYGGLAFSLAYSILRDRQAAEDIVQEAYLNVWRRAATFDATRGTVRIWLLTIVHHQAINLIRATRSRGGTAVDIDSVHSLTSGEDTAATVARGMHGERVREALATLSSDQRQVVELAYFGGLSHSEIARSAALPLGTVKGRVRLGLERLRATMPQWDEVST